MRTSCSWPCLLGSIESTLRCAGACARPPEQTNLLAVWLDLGKFADSPIYVTINYGELRRLIVDRVRMRNGSGIKIRSENDVKFLRIVLRRWRRNNIKMTPNYTRCELWSL